MHSNSSRSRLHNLAIDRDPIAAHGHPQSSIGPGRLVVEDREVGWFGWLLYSLLLSYYSSAVPDVPFMNAMPDAFAEFHLMQLFSLSIPRSCASLEVYCAVRLPLAFFLGVSAMVRSVT
jgi:hypothetical protein